MAFWGVEVKPGKPYTHQSSSSTLLGNAREKILRLRITQATLGHAVPNINKSVVQCNVGNRSPVLLCSLLPEKSESCSLELEFEESDDVVLSVLGPRSVHLTGYYLLSSGLSHIHNDDDSESFGEDIGSTESEPSYPSCEDKYESDFIDDDNINVVVSPEHNLVESDDEKHLNGAPKYRQLKKSISSEPDDDEKPSNRVSGHRRLRKKYKKSESENDEKPLDVDANHGSVKKCKIKDSDNGEVGQQQLNDPKYVQPPKSESDSEDETKVLDDFFIESKSVDMVKDERLCKTLEKMKKLRDDAGQDIGFGRNNAGDVISAKNEKPYKKKKNRSKGKSSADVSHACAEKMKKDATFLIEKTHKSEGTPVFSSILNGHNKCVQDVTNATDKISDEVLHACDVLDSKTPGFSNLHHNMHMSSGKYHHDSKKQSKRSKSHVNSKESNLTLYTGDKNVCAVNDTVGKNDAWIESQTDLNVDELAIKEKPVYGGTSKSAKGGPASELVKDQLHNSEENDHDRFSTASPSNDKNFHTILDVSSVKVHLKAKKESRKDKYYVSEPDLISGKEGASLRSQLSSSVNKEQVTVENEVRKGAKDGPTSVLAKDQLHESGENENSSLPAAKGLSAKNLASNKDLSPADIAPLNKKRKRKDKSQLDKGQKDTTDKDY